MEIYPQGIPPHPTPHHPMLGPSAEGPGGGMRLHIRRFTPSNYVQESS